MRDALSTSARFLARVERLGIANPALLERGGLVLTGYVSGRLFVHQLTLHKITDETVEQELAALIRRLAAQESGSVNVEARHLAIGDSENHEALFCDLDRLGGTDGSNAVTIQED